MRLFREEPKAVVGELQGSRVEPNELEPQRIEGELERKSASELPSQTAAEPRSSGFYYGQLMATTGLWVGTALIPWIGGHPAVELAGYPVGVAATIFLPFSAYFATVLNPSVSVVQKPYGIEYTLRSGYRQVIGIHGISRQMTPKEESELSSHNAEVARERRNQLKARRTKRLQLKEAKRTGQRS